jgi:hypothetical protein
MKEGAGDPFGDFEDEKEPESAEADESTEQDFAEETSEHSEDVTTTNSTLPYKYRRDTIQDGRSRKNLFLRDEADQDVESLIEQMDELFDAEDVYKFDVLEAALLAATENPDAVGEKLREMGYGMK